MEELIKGEKRGVGTAVIKKQKMKDRMKVKDRERLEEEREEG